MVTKWSPFSHQIVTTIFFSNWMTLSLMTSSLKLARPAGVEPTTYSFGNCHSIQMSYGRML